MKIVLIEDVKSLGRKGEISSILQKKWQERLKAAKLR